MNWTVTGILAAVPFVATLISTARGPGLSPDSVAYLSTGINLADGQGLTTFSGETLTVFPPGLPAIVAIGELVGLGADWTVRLLNALSFSASVALGAVLLARHVADRRLVVGATAFISVSVALLAVANMAYSEPLFIAVTLLFLPLLERALSEPDRWRWVLACAALVWVAFILRYVGVVLSAVGGATLIVGFWKVNRAAAIRKAVAFAFLGVAGPLAWMLRNLSVDGTLMGPRYPSIDTPAQVGFRVVHTVGLWLAPVPAPRTVLGLIGIGLLGGVVGSIILVTRTRDDDEPGPHSASLLPTALFGIIYIVYLAVAQLTSAFDNINSRLLSPVFVPLVLAVAVAIDHLEVLAPGWLRRLAAMVLIGVITVQAAAFVLVAAQSWREGRGYAQSEWQESGLAAAVADLPDDVAIYASHPDAIWAITARELVQMSPRLRAISSSDEPVEIPSDFLRVAECGEAFLAWFHANPRAYLRTPGQLADVVTLTPVAEFDEGTLYRLGPLGDIDCESGTPADR